MSTGFRPVTCLAVAAILLGGCSKPDVSGKYIAKFSNGVYWLQLVETPDHRVTGEFESLTMNPDGKVSFENLSVVGAANSNDVSLLFKPSFFPITVTASGTLNWKGLTLTGALNGGQPGTILFAPSDVSEYQIVVAAVNARSQNILAAKEAAEAHERAVRQEREFISRLESFVDRMQHFDGVADNYLRKFQAAEQRYRSITAKMVEYLNRERELANNPKAMLARSQISVEMNQGSIATDQLHIEIQPMKWDFDNNVVPLTKAANQTEESCNSTHPSAVNPGIIPDADAWTSSCRRFLDVVTPYRQKVDAISKAFIGLEVVYQDEQRKQQQLISESARIE